MALQMRALAPAHNAVRCSREARNYMKLNMLELYRDALGS